MWWNALDSLHTISNNTILRSRWVHRYRNSLSDENPDSSPIPSCTARSQSSGQCCNRGEPAGDSLLPELVPAGRVLGEEDRDEAGCPGPISPCRPAPAPISRLFHQSTRFSGPKLPVMFMLLIHWGDLHLHSFTAIWLIVLNITWYYDEPKTHARSWSN